MWNKLTLRMRITILTALALSFVAIGITSFSIYNAGQLFHIPIDMDVLSPDGYVQVYRVRATDIMRPLTPELLDELGRDGIEAQRSFRNFSITVAVIFVLIGTFGTYFITGQTLKPINSLAKKMENTDANNLTELIELPKTQDEVARLTHTFNNMLRKLNRSFESQKLFAQNAAHELKTPLTSIRASIEVLKLDDKPTIDDYKEMTEIVDIGTERLIELVEGLLSLNSVTDILKWQTFSGRETFDIIVNDLRADIARKGIEVDISGECKLKGDKTLLERAFFNLIHNAVRYNVDNGKVKITLSENSIVIEDNGVGIPAEHLPHIFEPFYCVDESRSKKLGGHGLGMAITKNIFDKHNMEISITSEPGQGTKIFLSM